MEVKGLSIVDVADLMVRIKDQEQHRAEGVSLFRDCLAALDIISKKTTVAEKAAIINTTVDALNQYLRNIVEYNEKQDELLDKMVELSDIEEMAN